MKQTNKCLCPWCGREIEVVPDYDAYEKKYKLYHAIAKDVDCPIATFKGEHLGTWLFDSEEEAYEMLEHRANVQVCEKPPIGLKPRYVCDTERVQEILEAVKRYRFANKSIPHAWIDELEELKARVNVNEYLSYLTLE